MKKSHKNLSFLIFLVLLFLTYYNTLLSQSDTTRTEVDFGEVEDIEETDERVRNNRNVHIVFGDNSISFKDGTDLRLGLLDIGFSTYLFDNSINLPQELDDFELLYNGSLNFNIHAIRHRVPIIKKFASLEYGLSFSFMRYKFANDFRLQQNTIPLVLEAANEPFKRSKLKTSFLEVPVMFTITPSRRQGIYLSGGWYAGVLLNAKQKIKTEEGQKIKIKDDFNLNKFRYGLIGRVGLGPIAFYGQIALNDLFKQDQGPVLTPINVGVSILNF